VNRHFVAAVRARGTLVDRLAADASHCLPGPITERDAELRPVRVQLIETFGTADLCATEQPRFQCLASPNSNAWPFLQMAEALLFIDRSFLAKAQNYGNYASERNYKETSDKASRVRLTLEETCKTR
jgi:hypothetical protein